MYHYVRDYKKTEYPNLKGLDVESFKFQIKYLKTKYNILSPIQIHEIIEKGKVFNANDCWLTFDDGYIDHYKYVLPILEENQIKASFFPPVKIILNETILDVNKIHFILAKNMNHDLIINEIKNIYINLNTNNEFKNFDELIKSIDTRSGIIGMTGLYDNSKIVLIKLLLQEVLPKSIRTNVCDKLFKKYVSLEIESFAKNLYMNISQVKEIRKLGHEIGMHGYGHVRLGRLSKKEQSNDIMKAHKFLKENGLIDNKFTICYPYGNYNSDTLKILSSINCLIGLTTKPGPIPKKNYIALELPRLDTNDFPQRENEINDKIH